MKTFIPMVTLLILSPVLAIAQTKSETPANLDPAVAQRREEIRAEIRARLETERAFIKSLEGKTPEEREAMIQARDKKDRPTEPTDPAIIKRREEIRAEIRTRLETDRAFIKSLEGKTPEERETMIQARDKKDRPAEPTDPAVIKRREEIRAEIRARLETERAFIKSLEGKTSEEREAMIQARDKQAH